MVIMCVCVVVVEGAAAVAMVVVYGAPAAFVVVVMAAAVYTALVRSCHPDPGYVNIYFVF
jgi:hypothetical protein